MSSDAFRKGSAANGACWAEGEIKESVAAGKLKKLDGASLRE